MDIKECYKEMGADYEDVLRRMGSDSLVERFTLRFLDVYTYYAASAQQCCTDCTHKEYFPYIFICSSFSLPHYTIPQTCSRLFKNASQLIYISTRNH